MRRLPIAQTQRSFDNVCRQLIQKDFSLLIVLGNILPESSAAPGILAQQRELEKHMRADSLNDKISHRPKPEDLVKEGVLHEDPTSPDKKDADVLYKERMEEEYAKREGGA